MHEKAFETLRENSRTLGESATALEAFVANFADNQGQRFDLSVSHPEIQVSLAEILSGVRGLVEFTSGLTGVPSIFVPRLLVDGLATKLSELKTPVNGFADHLKAVQSQHAGIAKIDPTTYAMTAGDGTAHNLAKQFNRILGILDQALDSYYQLRSVIDAPNIREFSEALERIGAYSVSSQQNAETISQVRSTAEQRQQEIAKLLETVNAERGEVSRLYGEAQNERKSLNEYTAEAAEKIASIRTTQSEAATLATTTNDYQAQFKKFDEQLAGREQRFVQENEELDRIKKDLAERSEEIKGLIGQSEGMLRGATNVGLAAGFSTLQEKINRELTLARYSFYFSIFLLVFLSLPIALYVFPGANEFLKYLTGWDTSTVVPRSGNGTTTPEVLAQVLARALLLIPGIWLVRFTAARHERLFRLREHYSYKLSIASAVEGFKKQAPDLEQGIAAVAFHELTFNPATRMDANSEEARHPNPLMEWFMKKLGASTSDAPQKSS